MSRPSTPMAAMIAADAIDRDSEAAALFAAAAAKDKTARDGKSWFQRNPRAVKALFAVLLTAAVFTAIFFTAGTTLPFVVGVAAKIGLNLGFLTATSTLLGSLALTGIVAGVNWRFSRSW